MLLKRWVELKLNIDYNHRTYQHGNCHYPWAKQFQWNGCDQSTKRSDGGSKCKQTLWEILPRWKQRI